MKLELPMFFGTILLADIFQVIFYGDTLGLSFVQYAIAIVPAFLIYWFFVHKGLTKKQVSKKLGISLICFILILQFGIDILTN